MPRPTIFSGIRQVGLKSPKRLRWIKTLMLRNRFRYNKNQISGWCDENGTYYISGGTLVFRQRCKYLTRPAMPSRSIYYFGMAAGRVVAHQSAVSGLCQKGDEIVLG